MGQKFIKHVILCLSSHGKLRESIARALDHANSSFGGCLYFLAEVIRERNPPIRMRPSITESNSSFTGAVQTSIASAKLSAVLRFYNRLCNRSDIGSPPEAYAREGAMYVSSGALASAVGPAQAGWEMRSEDSLGHGLIDRGRAMSHCKGSSGQVLCIHKGLLF